MFTSLAQLLSNFMIFVTYVIFHPFEQNRPIFHPFEQNKPFMFELFKGAFLWDIPEEIQVFRNENGFQTNAYSHYSNYSYSGLIPNEGAVRVVIRKFSQHFIWTTLLIQIQLQYIYIYFQSCGLFSLLLFSLCI